MIFLGYGLGKLVSRAWQAAIQVSLLGGLFLNGLAALQDAGLILSPQPSDLTCFVFIAYQRLSRFGKSLVPTVANGLSAAIVLLTCVV